MPTFVDPFDLEREGDTPRNWINTGATLAVFEISDDDLIDGLMSVDIKAGSSGNLHNALREVIEPFTDARPYKGTIWMLSAAEKHEIATFGGTGLDGEQLVRLRFNSTGVFSYREGGSWIAAGAYPSLADIDFEIRHDFVNGTYSFRVTDGGAFNVERHNIDFANDEDEVRFCGFSVYSDGRLTYDNIQIGELPSVFQEGDLQVQIGPYIVSTLDGVVQDYNILHELNEVAEAWIDLENVIANLVDAGDQMQIWIVPWGGSSLEQFFFGMIFDKVVSGPDTIRISARDALSTAENLEIDAFYFGGLRDNVELDIDQGVLSTDPLTITLPDSYSSIHKPLTRVQIGRSPGQVKRPTDSEISGLVRTNTTISQANGYRWIASPFVALHPRWVILGFEGDEPTPQTWTIKIVGSKLDGSPDLSQTLHTSTGNLSVSGFHSLTIFTDEPFRLNVGRKYYVLIGPDNPAVNYDYRFYSYDFRDLGPPPSPKVKTNKGVWRYNTVGPAWEETVPDETGRIIFQYIAWEDTKEGEDWSLQDFAGTAKVVFDGENTLRPPWVLSGSWYQKGARVFYSHGTIDLAAILADLLNDVAMVDYVVTTATTYIRFADALEINVLDFIKELMTLYNWRIRQRHRSEGSGTLDGPPVVVAEPWPVPSAVLTLKHGDDATDVTAQARVIGDSISKTTTDVFTMERISARTLDDRLLLYVQQIVDQQRALNLLNSRVIPNLSFGLRKQRVLKIRNANSLQDLQDVANAIEAQSGAISWKGDLDVDGATWIIPPQIINYQNSRRNIPATNFRVLAVQYLPHRMKLTLKNSPSRLEYILRDLQIKLGRFGTLQTVDLSTLQHTFYAWGEVDDGIGTVVAASDHRARLEDLSGGVSTWRHCDTIAGPTINGLPSKLISCFFPPDDGTEGQGQAVRVRVMPNVDVGAQVLVTLDVPAYHWADNAVSICVLLYQTP